MPVPVHVVVRPALQLGELLDHFLLARRRHAKPGFVAISLFVLSVMIEAGVAIAGAARSGGVHCLQVANHLLTRSVQAIKIEAIKTHLRRPRRAIFIVSTQPADEFFHLPIAPHPDRKTAEPGERLVGG